MIKSGYGVLATTTGVVHRGWVSIDPAPLSQWFEVWVVLPTDSAPEKHDVRGMRQVLGGHTRFVSWVVWDSETIVIDPPYSDPEAPLEAGWRLGRGPFQAHVGVS